MAKEFSQKRRYWIENAVYYITSVTRKREKIFLNDYAARFMVITLMYHKFIFDYKIYAYVVMPDHFHAIIQPTGKWNISKIMNYLKGTFSRKYNKIHKKKGHVWQKGFYDRVCRTRSSIISAISYIHQNPVRLGLVEKMEDYPYSSFWQVMSHRRSTDFIDFLPL